MLESKKLRARMQRIPVELSTAATPGGQQPVQLRHGRRSATFPGPDVMIEH
jgi:hypothetical protein